MKDSFVAKAADWDSPEKVKMTAKFVSEMLLNVTPQAGWKALEIGAGTGLVGLQIEPLVREVLMVDTSAAMLGVLKQKLNQNSKVEVLHGEILDYKEPDIDFVFSCMAFHHIAELDATLQHLAKITKPGAVVVIGDLVTEDGSFHRFEPIPHQGFDTVILSEKFMKVGFKVTQVKVYNTMTRVTDWETFIYEQFILIAQRV